ncbi:hypothetical protein GAYE_SCF08G3060 [Galdieria yellowstonensis]|uniref:Lipid-A-disaccharide synthase n=1 Tax=Galdieria yellowstonensis TaxID=3028027 RepID=A0AAV9ICT7_9RHOD|nr:hypothetical protein GAYE_SCF08G3060 [Galdieria yellowstonensis]
MVKMIAMPCTLFQTPCRFSPKSTSTLLAKKSRLDRNILRNNYIAKRNLRSRPLLLGCLLSSASSEEVCSRILPVQPVSNEKVLLDLVILTNGPGELNTWVRPVVEKLRSLERDSVPSWAHLRISILLCPCVHASGSEFDIAKAMSGVDRVLPPKLWLPFLLFGYTGKFRWNWHSQGVVLHLGGDQFFAGCIARRLGFKSVAYVEWKALWPGWVDYYLFARRSSYHKNSMVIGDLSVDASASILEKLDNSEVEQSFGRNPRLIALLPGSKEMKLASLVPLFFGICDVIQQSLKGYRFVLFLAPGVTVESICRFADSKTNRLVSLFGEKSSVYDPQNRCFMTANGTRIDIWDRIPAYHVLRRCKLALSCVGANTAELAGIGLPTFVVVPTQQLDAMRAWDGILGILCNIPFLGRLVALFVNWLVVFLYRKGKFGYLALPNKWVNRMVMPEFVGKVTCKDIGIRILACISTPNVLYRMRREIIQVCQPFGAVSKLSIFVWNVLLMSTMKWKKHASDEMQKA